MKDLVERCFWKGIIEDGNSSAEDIIATSDINCNKCDGYNTNCEKYTTETKIKGEKWD